MKNSNKTAMQRALVMAATLTLTSGSLWAEEAHHPEGAASTAGAAATQAPHTGAMEKMDTKIQAMQEMHEKMMAAKSPEERSALMAEHMKTMQDAMAMMGGKGGMGMMGGMHGKDAGGMGMMGGMHGKDAGAMQDQMPADMPARQQMMGKRMEMMEKRMEMMESMMQMMLDRMPSVPATE